MQIPRLFGWQVRWALGDEGLHIAARGGEFIGYVIEGRAMPCVAYDGSSRVIGHFDRLEDAMAAVSGHGPNEVER